MPRSELLASARIPDTNKDLMLYRHQDKFSIVIPGRGELMNSRVHGSEIALAELACAAMEGSARPRLLVGGLGMGFTLAAALAQVDDDSEVVVAELVPEVVAWNRDLMGEPSGHPLSDPRTTVFEGDIADLLRNPGSGFDAIMMDVDNGPAAMIRRENDWLYTDEGLAVMRQALRPGGVLAVWSAGPDRLFQTRLRRGGFRVEERIVRPHRAGKGARHYIWLGRPT
jgi:spermidine synthase